MTVSPDSRIFLNSGIDAYNDAISMEDPKGNYATAILYLNSSMSYERLSPEEKAYAERILKDAISKHLGSTKV